MRSSREGIEIGEEIVSKTELWGTLTFRSQRYEKKLRIQKTSRQKYRRKKQANTIGVMEAKCFKNK